MQIIVNGKNEEVQTGISLMDYILSRRIEPEKAVVEYNFEIAGKEEWSKITLKQNDNLEILRFVGGG